jgi:hypothetical protein
VEPEILAGVALVGALAAVAAYYAWRQLATLRRLRQDANLSALDRRYLWQQALRRLCNSGLMLVFAALLLGGFFIQQPLPVDENAAPLLRSAAENQLRLYTGYWIGTLLVMLAFLGLAVVDLWATARYGFRHHKELEQDRRAMLEEEATRIRRWRQQMN